jgi:hypothetical protein
MVLEHLIGRIELYILMMELLEKYIGQVVEILYMMIIHPKV